MLNNQTNSIKKFKYNKIFFLKEKKGKYQMFKISVFILFSLSIHIFVFFLFQVNYPTSKIIPIKSKKITILNNPIDKEKIKDITIPLKPPSYYSYSKLNIEDIVIPFSSVNNKSSIYKSNRDDLSFLSKEKFVLKKYGDIESLNFAPWSIFNFFLEQEHKWLPDKFSIYITIDLEGKVKVKKIESKNKIEKESFLRLIIEKTMEFQSPKNEISGKMEIHKLT